MALIWYLGLFSKYSIQYASLFENLCPLSD